MNSRIGSLSVSILVSLLTALTLELAGCGGGGGGSADTQTPPPPPPQSQTPPASMRLSTTSVQSYDDVHGQVSNVKTGYQYAVRYSLGNGATADFPLTLASDNTFTTMAPAGVIDRQTLTASGTVPAKLLEISSAGAITPLNEVPLSVTVPQSDGTPLGYTTLIFAVLQVAIQDNALQDQLRLQGLGKDPFPSINLETRKAFWVELEIAADEISRTNQPYTFHAPNASGDFTLTPDALKVLDQQFFLILRTLPPPPTMMLPTAMSNFARARSKAALRAKLGLAVSADDEPIEVIDSSTWGRDVGQVWLDAAPRFEAAAQVTLAAVGLVAGAAAVTGVAIVGAQIVMIGMAAAAVDIAIEGAVAKINKGKAEWEDVQPGLSYIGKSYVKFGLDEIISDGAKELCDEHCSLGFKLAKSTSELFEDAESTVDSGFDDGTYPTTPPASPTPRGLVNLGLSVGHPTGQPNFTVGVYFTPSPVAQQLTIRVSVLGADGRVLSSKRLVSAASFSTDFVLTKAQVCPSLRFVAWDEGGPAITHSDFPGTEFCDDSAGNGAAVEEFIDWSINGTKVAHVVPDRKYLLHEGASGPLYLDLNAYKSASSDRDLVPPDISIDARPLVPGGAATAFSATGAGCATNNSGNVGWATVANAQWDALQSQIGQAPQPYQMFTCDYNRRHGVNSAGSVSVTIEKIPMTDDPTTFEIENFMQVAKGSFTYSVGDPDVAAAGGFALGDRLVAGTFQLKIGTCTLSGGNTFCPLD